MTSSVSGLIACTHLRVIGWKAARILVFATWLSLAWELIGAQSLPPHTPQKAAAEAEKKRLTALREQIDKLNQDLTKSEESRSEVADQLKESEKAISEVNRSLVELSREQNKISETLISTQQRIQTTRTDALRQQDLLDRLIRHQYMHGNTDQLRLVLDGQEVSVVERHLQYGGYLSKARATLIARLKKSLADLATLETEAQQKNADLAANATQQKTARAAIEAERIQRRKVLNRIAIDIKKNRREIGRLKRDEDRLTRLVDQLTKAILRKPVEKPKNRRKADPADSSNPDGNVRQPGPPIESEADAGFIGRAFQTLQGKLKLPTRGELASRFGTPREDSGVTWKGLFIKSSAGQSVRAVADGNIVFADWLRGYGNLLILDHGNGYLSLYGHNESLLKNVGDAVTSGEAIASVGSTGGAAESGVYFELRHDGKPFDPMKWVGK